MEDPRASREPDGSTTRPLPGPEASGLLPDPLTARVPVGAAPGVPPPGAATAVAEPPPFPPGPVIVEAGPPNRWLGLLVIAVSQLLIVLDATIVNVALPAMAVDLQIAEADRQWVVTAYTLAFGGLLLLGGRIADHVGRRKVFLVGSLGFALASGLGGLAQDPATLLAARAGQGVFGALLAPAALALVTTMFHDPNERAKAFAVFGAVAGGGAAVGLILGGMLTEWASWRWTMFINVPIALGTVVAGLALLPESREAHRGRIDVIGGVLATAGLLAVVYSFSEAERKGWTEPATLFFIGIGLSLLIVFTVSQRMVRNPLLPLRVLADRTRAGANIAVLLGMVGMFGVFFFLSFYMQGVLGFKPVKTGVAFLPVTGGIIISSAIVSAIAAKIPPRVLMAGGLFGTAASLLLLVRITPTSDYAPDLLPALFLMGFSLGAVFVPAFNAATIGVAPTDAGVASAAVNTSQQVGGSLGLALLSTVAADHATAWLAQRPLTEANVVAAQVEGYARATLWAATIVAAAGLITLVLVNVRRLELSPHAEFAARDAVGTVGGPAAGGPAVGGPAAPAPRPAVAPDPPPVWRPAADGPPVLPPLSVDGPVPVAGPPPGPPPEWPPPPWPPPPTAPGGAPVDFPAPPSSQPGPADGAPAPARPVVWPPPEAPGVAPVDLPVVAAEAAAAPPERPVVWPPPPEAPGAVPVDVPPVDLPPAAAAPERQVVWPPPPEESAAPPAPNGKPAPPVAVAPPAAPAQAAADPARATLSGVVRASTGTPVAGSALTVLDAGGRQVGRGMSEPDGSFAFPLPGAGEFVLVARRAGHRPHAVSVLVRGGPAADGAVHVDVVLTGAAALAGAVRATGTGSPVRGALVTLTDPAGDVVASARTDERGDYEIPELTTGTFTMVVTTPSCRPTAQIVEIAGEGRTRIDVDVAGSATLTGIARTRDGRPVADARVTLTGPGGQTVAVTRTAADGTYSFDDLDEGAYLVRAVGYPPATSGVELAPGEAAAQEITLDHAEDDGPG